MATADELLTSALPGQENPSKRWTKPWADLAERPWRRWQANDVDWAVYILVGDRLSAVAIQSIDFARRVGLRSVIIVPEISGLAAISPQFTTLGCHIICMIAGKARLIAPPEVTPGAPKKRRRSPSRIPVGLLIDLENRAQPATLKNAIRGLRKGLQQLISKRQLTDELEHELLKRYATSILKHSGFRFSDIEVPSMIRSLEASGWGGRRDHFFHSFQNYFFGLFAILEIPDSFSAYSLLTRLHWNIVSSDVWFLTALWHDVGYGVERAGAVLHDIWGPVFDDDLAGETRIQYLKTPIIQDALRDISCLMVRLLRPQNAKTAWLPPEPQRRRTATELRVEEALKTNVLKESHGVASSLRLYAEYMPRIKKMNAENQLVPKQIVLLACCSAPFHDWHFRDCLRDACGDCSIGTNALPFASLLAFVDSIQDDRRDLRGLKEELSFLRRLKVSLPATITADVDRHAIPDAALLWKVVEARDVTACLLQSPESLFFSYPQWMVA